MTYDISLFARSKVLGVQAQLYFGEADSAGVRFFGHPAFALPPLTNATILPHLLKALTGHQVQQLKRSLTWKNPTTPSHHRSHLL